MKALNSHLQGMIPRTLSGLKGQISGASKMIHHLETKDMDKLGGFRIEISVQAPTLADAKRMVEATLYLNPEYWFGFILGLLNIEHSTHSLSARVDTKAAFLENAMWIYQKAQVL